MTCIMIMTQVALKRFQLPENQIQQAASAPLHRRITARVLAASPSAFLTAHKPSAADLLASHQSGLTAASWVDPIGQAHLQTSQLWADQTVDQSSAATNKHIYNVDGFPLQQY
eukprot:GHUV01050242.1.p1 GENE.GHUV01050242.1~~GHUV01050242.1.p1  ORF type:complete len:113 (-),score=12.95 GHUV01050242.1:54-392(-)